MTTQPLRLGIVLSTIREGRFGDIPANWILQEASSRPRLAPEIIDLRHHRLPLLGDVASESQREAIDRWGATMEGLDGYLFVTAEYNHSIPGPLKNALDYLGSQLHRKPAAFVGYGGIGSARAIEQLRQILIEFEMAPLRNATHIGMEPYLAVINEQALLGDFGFLQERAAAMLDELIWWGEALRTARAATASGASEAR